MTTENKPKGLGDKDVLKPLDSTRPIIGDGIAAAAADSTRPSPGSDGVIETKDSTRPIADPKKKK